MAKIDNEKIKKLPKWVQEHIKKLEREREVSIRKLNHFCDNQTVSPIYVDDHVCTGENQGPTSKRHYIQSISIEIEHLGVYLQIICHKDSLDLRWSNGYCGSGDVAFVPECRNSARLVSKENMRD